MSYVIWNRTKNIPAFTSPLPSEEDAQSHLERLLSNLPWDERDDDFVLVEIPDA